MRNREIAQELFVTVKAFQWHLGHVYSELGIGSRQELGEALTDGGGLTADPGHRCGASHSRLTTDS